ncbi:hypothetical protein F5879DRAFT_980696 [Lentinula edodes]|nr:hypothetical protein F5879DRAFT_980696 [Lentinula edodes]
MVYPCSVLTTAIIAVGVASSALAIPLSSSAALSDMVSMPGTATAPFDLKPDIQMPVPLPSSVNSHGKDLDSVIFDNHTGLTHPTNPTDVLPKVGPVLSGLLDFVFNTNTHLQAKDQSLSASSSLSSPTPPIHIERRDTMSKEQAKSYLNELEVSNRWSLVTIFQTMPLRAWNMKNSKNWKEFKEKKEVKEYIEKNQLTDPGVPRFFEAYYLCVKGGLLDWCIASE